MRARSRYISYASRLSSLYTYRILTKVRRDSDADSRYSDLSVDVPSACRSTRSPCNQAAHSGRMANALASNARGDRFTPHLRRYFRYFSRPEWRRFVNWSVWHIAGVYYDLIVMPAVMITSYHFPCYQGGPQQQSTSSTHTLIHRRAHTHAALTTVQVASTW